MTLKEYRALGKRKGKSGKNRPGAVARSPQGAWARQGKLVKMPGGGMCSMTHTEWLYLQGVLRGCGKYEPIRLRITPEGVEPHYYTPDFETVLGDGTPVFHEVKGTYRLQSQDAARLRFCFAALANPGCVFVWAKLNKNRTWDVEVWRWGGHEVVKFTNVVKMFTEDSKTVWQSK